MEEIETKIKISQSLIKELKKENYCPRRIKASYIDGLEGYTTNRQLKGNYFEYKTLKSTDKFGNVPELPKLKNGKASAEEIRIIEQALAFEKHKKNEKFEITILATNVSIELNYADVTLSGRIDFLGTIKYSNGTIANLIGDLKLTGEFQSYGDFCWNRPEFMDHTQAIMYQFLVKEYFNSEEPSEIKELLDKDKETHFIYFVYDYSTKKQYSFIRVLYNSMREAELKEDIRKTHIAMLEMQEQNFPYNASYDDCKKCPLKKECTKRQTIRDIKQI